jgi:hypothetical protein
MDKITYLIGAGASFGTIPLISGFADGIKHLGSEISRHETILLNKASVSESNYRKKTFDRFLKDCENFERKSRIDGSVDTVAFKLNYNSRISELQRLKAIISFVIIYSTFKNAVNSRYNHFFTKILNPIRPNKFKYDVRVVSWNYDFLFERSFSGFSDRSSLFDNQSLLNVNPDSLIEGADGEFKLFKINGTTAFHSSRPGRKLNLWNDFENDNLPELMEKFLNVYDQSTWGIDEYVSDISFAFENLFEQNESHVLNTTLREIEGSKALILIGYSFPHINKEYDKKILEKLFPNVQKVFIQSEENKGVIMNRIISIDKNYYPEMFVEMGTNDFYVPYETF